MWFLYIGIFVRRPVEPYKKGRRITMEKIIVQNNLHQADLGKTELLL